jgi:hypothetical protein
MMVDRLAQGFEQSLLGGIEDARQDPRIDRRSSRRCRSHHCLARLSQRCQPHQQQLSHRGRQRFSLALGRRHQELFGEKGVAPRSREDLVDDTFRCRTPKDRFDLLDELRSRATATT